MNKMTFISTLKHSFAQSIPANDSHWLHEASRTQSNRIEDGSKQAVKAQERREHENNQHSANKLTNKRSKRGEKQSRSRED
jgi:hypothetical protein